MRAIQTTIHYLIRSDKYEDNIAIMTHYRSLE